MNLPMVRFKKKFYMFKLTDTWFQYQYSFGDYFGLRQYSFVQNPELVKKHNCIKTITHTVELSLLPEMETIQSQFRKTVVQEIRKAESSGISCVFKNDIETFIPFFNEFAALKKIYPAKREMIESIGENFHTSFALYEGEILVAHSYIVDRELGIARLFQSASRRLDDRFDRKLIGLANKLLTAKDIGHYKAIGYRLMDFGGYAFETNDTSLKGINDFKTSFGGEVKSCTNFQSLPYFVLRNISEKLDRRY
jgi:hypothetical protein